MTNKRDTFKYFFLVEFVLICLIVFWVFVMYIELCVFAIILTLSVCVLKIVCMQFIVKLSINLFFDLLSTSVCSNNTKTDIYIFFYFQKGRKKINKRRTNSDMFSFFSISIKVFLIINILWVVWLWKYFFLSLLLL